jgi:hypothetical protein
MLQRKNTKGNGVFYLQDEANNKKKHDSTVKEFFVSNY